MRITQNKQSRLRHLIGTPKRFLRMARDFYVDSMVNFDGKVANANVVPQPPKTFGGYSSGKVLNDDENLEELRRSFSKKYSWSSVEFDKGCLNEGCKRVSGYSAMDRSYSIALGKIGTIDEEEPCDFQEKVFVRSEILLPRSKSHAVTRKNGFY
ncbi:hypothetical protein CDL12_29205 [Handroanthus impetiginosus]|uniref:Uncharacterized protein n=1 Tax=Handroanthus impetiginosus TaxID=429701 RepID=A0A2G9FZ21_9LAMI|nr:hypothetical protein CDL12_29205 [Handroanthus impetiginosus]